MGWIWLPLWRTVIIGLGLRWGVRSIIRQLRILTKLLSCQMIPKSIPSMPRGPKCTFPIATVSSTKAPEIAQSNTKANNST